jgi:hypothetical protein
VLSKPRFMMANRLQLASLFALGLTFGCNVSIPKNKPQGTTASATTSGAASAVATAAATDAAPTNAEASSAPPAGGPALPPESQAFRIPVGPALPILPGEGIGPIRFGASLETIQRLIEGTCTDVVKEEGLEWCRFQPNAVDFGLAKGKLVKIRIHGSEREFVRGKGLGVDNAYGVFNGKFLNGAQLGMYPDYASQGKPLRIQKVTPGRHPTVERHHYDGMVLEFDKLQNGNTVLAGVVLTKSKNAKKPKAAPKAGSSKQVNRVPLR